MRPLRPNDIPKIIADKDEAGIYEILEQRGVDAARDAYRKAFGVPINGKTIDAEIESHLQEAIWEPQRRRYVPARILLALVLREGGAGRGTGKRKSVDLQLADARVMARFKKLKKELKKELRAQGVPEEEVLQKVEEVLQKVSKASKLSPEALRDGRVNRKRPNRKKPKDQTICDIWQSG